MVDFELTRHARDMLEERGIPEEWVWQTASSPDIVEQGEDGNTHFIGAIPERGGRFLRVIVNQRARPGRVVTVFLDRRLGRTI